MAEAGHNSVLTKEENYALIIHHAKKLIELQEPLKEAQDNIKKAKGTIKGDGIKIKNVEAAVRLIKMEDQNIFVDELNELYGVAEALGAIAKGSHDDLFADRRPIEDIAYDQGVVAGQMGKEPEPEKVGGYGADSSAGQRWLEGWHEGQRIMRETLASAMEKVNATKDDGDSIENGEEEDPGFPDNVEDD